MARRVLTERGARYFGVPIGTLITPDAEDDAKALHEGRPAPPGSVSGSNQKRAGTKEDDSAALNLKSSEPEDSNTKVGPAKRKESVQEGFQPKMVKPTLTGTQKVSVGKTSYNIPEGSSAFKSPGHTGRVYIVTPEGNAHVYTSGGEMELTPEQRRTLAAEVSSTLQAVNEVKEEKAEDDVTWVRLVSIARQIAQAEAAGDTSQVKKLEQIFKEGLHNYAPEKDPRTVRSEIQSRSGKKKKED